MFSKIEGLWDTYVVPIFMEELTSPAFNATCGGCVQQFFQAIRTSKLYQNAPKPLSYCHGRVNSHLMPRGGCVQQFFKLLGPQNCIRMPHNYCCEAQSLDALLVMSTGPTPTITSIPKRGTYQCVNKALSIWTYFLQVATWTSGYPERVMGDK